MQVENRLLDIIRCSAVVVNHGYAGDRFQKRLAFDLIRTVCVNNNKKTAVVCFNQCVLPGNEEVGIVLRGLEFFNQALAGILLQIDHDSCRAALSTAQAQKTDGGAESIEICHAVSHDINGAGLANQF